MTSFILISMPLPGGARTLHADPWEPNPLVAGYKRDAPALYAAALAEQPAPTLFASGADLPPFTASGVDVTFLTWLPFGCRHQAASEPTAARMLELIETHGKDPDATLECDGLTDYINRVRDWITGNGITHNDVVSETDSAVYDSIFAESEAAEVVRRKAVNDQYAQLNALRNKTGNGSVRL